MRAIRKIMLAAMLVFIISIAGCSNGSQINKGITYKEPGNKEAYQSLNEYYSSIDYSCKTNADCSIKDIRNCCGTYPQCTNNKAAVDTDFVTNMCEQENAASICGFIKPAGCACVNNRCEATTQLS